MSDSYQFDCRGRSYVLCFVMANALPFSPPLRFTVSLHSVLHRHFLYHMYIRVVSVVCYNSLCFLPLLKSLKFAWIYILWDVFVSPISTCLKFEAVLFVPVDYFKFE